MAEKIKIRWKEGVGLFVFLILSGLYFFGTPDFSGVLDYKYDYYNEDIVIFLFRVILPVPFLVGVYLYFLYKTEKRIKEGRFGFLRLFVFSLAMALAGGLIWETAFDFSSSYDYGGSDTTKQLAYFSFWRFHVFPAMTIFVFSLAPSLIFYRFKESVKKFHRATIVLFLFIFVGLFSYQQAGDLTCGFNYDSYCVGNKAVKTKDISLCEKVKTTKEFSNYDNYGKNSCYEAISRRWDDISLCDKIRIVSDQKHYSQYQLHQCVSSIARNTKNKELCEKIPVSKFKEICFKNFERKIGNSGDLDTEDQDYREIIVDVKGKILFITSGGVKDSLLNQILSTFKFTD